MTQRSRTSRALCAALALALPGCASWQLHWPAPAGAPDATQVGVRPPLVASPAAELPVPEHLRAGNDGYRAIPLQWEPVLQSSVAGYAIERASEPDGVFRRIAELWGRGESVYVDTGGASQLGDGVTAYYRLRPFASDGRLAEDTSPIVAGSTARLPGPPPALRAFSRQPREIPLAWRASRSEFATGYVVERSPSPEGPYQIVARVPGRFATSHVDRELGNLRVLFYRVATETPSGASGAPSEPVRAVTKPEPLPPLGLRLAEAELGRNVLRWEPNVETDIAEYRLLRIHEGGATQLVTTVAAGATTAEDPQVGARERATYALVAVDRDGLESRPSAALVVESVGYELEGAAGSRGVSLRWAPRADEFTQARVMRSSWLGGREVGRTLEHSFLDPDVRPGRSYRYVVVLIRPDGSEAPPSEPVEVRVPEPR